MLRAGEASAAVANSRRRGHESFQLSASRRGGRGRAPAAQVTAQAQRKALVTGAPTWVGFPFLRMADDVDGLRRLSFSPLAGITGQDGSYLAELLVAKGYEVHGALPLMGMRRQVHACCPQHLHSDRRHVWRSVALQASGAEAAAPQCRCSTPFSSSTQAASSCTLVRRDCPCGTTERVTSLLLNPFLKYSTQHDSPARTDHPLHSAKGDMTDASALAHIVAATEPDEVFNLAAQSHVAVSFDAPACAGPRAARPCVTFPDPRSRSPTRRDSLTLANSRLPPPTFVFLSTGTQRP